MITDKTMIAVNHVSKTFKLPHEKQTSLKSVLLNFYRHKKSFERQQVLNDVSFEVKQGEFFGIVGRNGSGKSTLLKLLAGIYSPDKGTIQVNGRLTPFIELGVGFNHELTGRENVFLNGALLGFSHKEMEAMYDEIVDFAELEKFMDQKLKNYSSGMQVRLAFSIAIRAQSDILLIDEVLAVGDVNFQNKCLAIFEELKKRGTTIVFISHDMESVRRFCDRAVLIETGKITLEGEPQKIIDRYMDLNSEIQIDDSLPFGVDPGTGRDESKLTITKTRLIGAAGKPVDRLKKGEDYSIEVTMRFKAACDDYVPGVVVRNQNGIRVTASNTTWAEYSLPAKKAGETLTVRFRFPNVLERGIYHISANVANTAGNVFYAWDNDAVKVRAEHDFLTGGVVNPRYTIEIV